jgi:hypothetical protein
MVLSRSWTFQWVATSFNKVLVCEYGKKKKVDMVLSRSWTFQWVATSFNKVLGMCVR